MVASIPVPFSALGAVRLYGKAGNDARQVMVYDKALGKSSDTPATDPRTGALQYRHPVALILGEGGDVIDATLTCDQEAGFGALTPISLDPASAVVVFGNQRNEFDLRVSLSGSVQSRKSAS